MRLLKPLLLLGAAVVAIATPEDDDVEDAPEEPAKSTLFNGVEVPPMLQLTPANWKVDSVASRFLLVKHYSPWCPHCIEFAPTYQTLYEWYYTSHPEGSGNQDANFTKFYDFRFGSINCFVYGDLCSEHGVQSYPTITLYKNGNQVNQTKGAKTMDHFVRLIEETLEQEKPGTRPTKPKLPEPGANYSPDHAPKVDKTGPNKSSLDSDSKTNDVAPEQSTDSEKEKEKLHGAELPAETEKPKDVDVTSKAAPASHKTLTWKPKKPAVMPNPDGASLALTGETFQNLVTMTQDIWFVKFFTPWCHHCQAMAPNWQQLAKEMKNQLNVGEVNCDAESKLCKDVEVKRYPSIHFFRGGERVEYDGLRGVGDLIQRAKKALDVSQGVIDVDAESLKVLEEKEDVIFIYFYDHATTTEDFKALERLTLGLIGRARLVKSQDPELYKLYKISTWPRLLVSREGRPTYYPSLTPKEMRSKDHVFDWMRSVWLPIVSELTASNARDIMNGKLVVLGILNRGDQDSFQRAIREMKSAANEWMDKQVQLFQIERQELRDAKQLRIDEAEDRGDQRALRAANQIKINMDKSDRKEVYFAWVDGVFWQRWVRTTYGTDIKDGERVIINDEDNRLFWDQTITGNNIIPSRTSILETLTKVTAQPPKIKPKLTISSFEKVIFDIRMTFKEHPYLSTGCFLGLAFGITSWFRGRLFRKRGGYLRLEDNMMQFASMGSLPGFNVNGKKD